MEKSTAEEASAVFQCRQCGECCRWPGYVYLTGEDIRMLADGMQVGPERFIQDFTRLSPNRQQLCLTVHSDGACILLGDDNRCRFYSARPQQCRDYPSRWQVPGGCPGYR